MTPAKAKLTRLEAAQHLKVSESTLDRMIRRGDLAVEKEQHGSRYKVWVIVDNDSEQSDDQADESHAETTTYSKEIPADRTVHSPNSIDHEDGHELTALRTEVRNLRELAEYRGQLLKDAEWRYQELLQQLKLSQETSATLARALPAPTDEAISRPRRRRWWPFGSA